MAKPGPKTKYRTVTAYGYVAVYEPDHPDAWKNGRMLEHRLVVSKAIGRRLRKDEHVHHKDDNRQNNHIDNLELLSPAEHTSFHKREASTGKTLRSMPLHRLRRLYGKFGSDEIAVMHSTTRSTVLAILREKGIQVRKPHVPVGSESALAKIDAASKEELAGLYQHLGLNRLGEKYGVSQAAASSRLVRYGIPLRKRGVTIHRPRMKGPQKPSGGGCR